MSKEKKKRCRICHKWFAPDPRTAHKQTCCPAPACQKQRRAQTNTNWWVKNPDYAKSRKAKVRQWASGPPSYWQSCRRKMARRKALNAAKQDLMALGQSVAP